MITLLSPRPDQWACELSLGSSSPQLSAKLGAWLRAGGVPHSLRPQLWPRLLAARPPPRPTYKEILSGAASRGTQEQIEKVRTSGHCSNCSYTLHHCVSLHQDLLRTLPTNICFRGPESPGVARLRRVLRALASHCPDTGYCQGMGVVAATLLLFCPEVWRSIDSV